MIDQIAQHLNDAEGWLSSGEKTDSQECETRDECHREISAKALMAVGHLLAAGFYLRAHQSSRNDSTLESAVESIAEAW